MRQQWNHISSSSTSSQQEQPKSERHKSRVENEVDYHDEVSPELEHLLLRSRVDNASSQSRCLSGTKHKTNPFNIVKTRRIYETSLSTAQECRTRSSRFSFSSFDVRTLRWAAAAPREEWKAVRLDAIWIYAVLQRRKIFKFKRAT